jgi:predicted dehydrogenase
MKINVGVVGLGYWGPNYLRNLSLVDGVNLIWACDLDSSIFPKLKKLYPNIKFTNNYQDLLTDTSLNAVAIATPPQTHFKLIKNAIAVKKHVFAAKPMTETVKEANYLLKLASKNKVNLFCDLTYLYTGAVIKIKSIIGKGEIGIPMYYDSVRTNLGLIQSETNVITDLLPHDLAILLDLFNFKPKKITVSASKHLPNSKTEEVASVTITFSNNFTAYLHLSWITPTKMRIIQIGGTKKMIYFDDVAVDEKVKIYNTGIQLTENEITPFKPLYRSGDVVSPKISGDEALLTELTDFIKETQSKKFAYKTSKMSITIAKILEACQKSLKTGKTVSF